MADAFWPDNFDSGAFDEEAVTAEMRFYGDFPASSFVVVGQIVFEGASGEMLLSVTPGSISGVGLADLTPADSAEMVLFSGGGTMSLRGGTFTGPNRPAGGVIIEYGGKFFSADDRFRVIRRRFTNRNDGRVILTLEKIRHGL